MSLNLYMVGVIVEDMTRSVEFYRRLGVAIPESSENKQHVEIQMNGVTFFLHTKQLNHM
ncbi:MAG: Catechol 2,3-dioxygenase or other lactoylglutathione lyase family enzyme [Chloroflexi bacterium AL-W]|nr:Catechol 2,3-dioxygenase or other lactoylglutathione lyase family enzyme [Chloroflexi bacterium AL-N1]NOK67727.1 Catechol 2,3-dioxygenase or other lactoylglutathione lyase family enzyme [Chloroflexi bacterium AL-N10]NOK75503.1 Catechol 2,3-dioxygenase or other lactoylglutathione lyase family enzyme [Chloroflexi bacterium AL-N5]NOK82291.1 Catechol 2,3-dioxygenase or other lactoylglutathione lyase family enzyme [Chloroflexi bacterium AL-W]NOK90136.1 Catechol 2,3-dioxygenase or other lactoylglu